MFGGILRSIYELFQLPQKTLEVELRTLSLRRAASKNDPNNAELNTPLDYCIEYCKGLAAYLSGDLSELSNIINEIKGGAESKSPRLRESVLLILELRFAVREKNLNQIQKIISDLEKLSPPALAIEESYCGEFYFVLARSYELLLNYEKAVANYKLAAQHYKQQKLNKKYLKSLFNAMINKHYLNDITNIDEYHELLRAAISERDRSVIGSVLLNLSFQMLFSGAYNSALRINIKCLRFLRFETKSLNYHLAELNLAHIYYLLEYYTEFKKLVNHLDKSNYPEIKAGVQLLKTFDFNERPLKDGTLTLSWTWRFHKKMSSLSKLSELEDKLLGYLTLAPRTRGAMISYLWPELSKEESSNDRIKKTLSRLKSKRPHSIYYDSPYYKLKINEIDKNIFLRNDLIAPMEVRNSTDARSILVGDELKLMELLSSSSYNFYELIEKVYPVEHSVDKLTNRLKNLLLRVRKKCPHRLHYREGRYYWV